MPHKDLEGQTSLTLPLHFEAIRGLDVEIGGILILVFTPAKETEAPTGTGQGFVCL
jgi:hypothetical protein